MLSSTGPSKLKNETQFQRSLRASLKGMFGDAMFVQKTHGNQFTGAGVSDLIGHLGGKFFGLELKMKGNRPSPDQYRWMKKQIDAGGFGFWVIYDKDEQCTYWVPGSEQVSYRDKKNWIKSDWVQKTYKGEDGTMKKLYIIDCTPMFLLGMKRL